MAGLTGVEKQDINCSLEPSKRVPYGRDERMTEVSVAKILVPLWV